MAKKINRELGTLTPVPHRVNQLPVAITFYSIYLTLLERWRKRGSGRAVQPTPKVQPNSTQIRSLKTNVNCAVACLLTANCSCLLIGEVLGRWVAVHTYAINSKQLR